MLQQTRITTHMHHPLLTFSSFAGPYLKIKNAQRKPTGMVSLDVLIPSFAVESQNKKGVRHRERLVAS